MPISLERAIALAVEEHKGQEDEAGEPYILHPLRVMLALHGETIRTVAVFHDVLEHCLGWDIRRLQREGFSLEMVEALLALAKRPEERGEDGYMRYVKRLSADPIARLVKIAELKDNMDLDRFRKVRDEDVVRLARYERALKLLDRS